MPSIIDNLYNNTSQLLDQLGQAGDLSMQSFANENLRKALLLSAASWFEGRVCAAMEAFSAVHSGNHPGIRAMIKRWAVDGMYFRYFAWREQKPGQFYSQFGDECSAILKSEINGSPELKQALADFLELGNLRNELVHENFASYPFEKTAEEVYALFQSAERFVIYLETRLPDSKFGRTAFQGASE
jgi:hypothetical protein